jgi:hypothetical protein
LSAGSKQKMVATRLGDPCENIISWRAQRIFKRQPISFPERKKWLKTSLALSSHYFLALFIKIRFSESTGNDLKVFFL